MALDQPAPTLAAPNAHCVRFTGSGREYFGIWIVNLLLSIVTLGLVPRVTEERELKSPRPS